MKPLPTDARDAIERALPPGGVAAPELILTALRAEQTDRAAVAVSAITRRLVETDAQLAALRSVVAEVLAELDEGDLVSAGDIRYRLQRGSIDLDDDIEQVAALRAAEATAGVWL